jgi:hypothetical protein
MAQKLTAAESPAVVCVPMRGWGACDTREANKDLGWAGPGCGPSWIPDPARPEWSLRSKCFVDGLRETLDLRKPNLELLLVDRHMNEPDFADLMAGLLIDMLAGKWRKGSCAGMEGITSL